MTMGALTAPEPTDVTTAEVASAGDGDLAAALVRVDSAVVRDTTRNASGEAVLVIDDDDDVLTAARLLLKGHFARVLTSGNPEDIPRLMDEHRVDVFLLDMNFAIGRNTGEEGLRWLGEIRRRDPDAVVILMTAFGDLNTAVRAMREGAADFVLKPWQNDKLLATVSVAADLRQARARVSALSEPPPVGRQGGVFERVKCSLRVVNHCECFLETGPQSVRFAGRLAGFSRRSTTVQM